jgi:hypothetical protein
MPSRRTGVRYLGLCLDWHVIDTHHWSSSAAESRELTRERSALNRGTTPASNSQVGARRSQPTAYRNRRRTSRRSARPSTAWRRPSSTSRAIRRRQAIGAGAASTLRRNRAVRAVRSGSSRALSTLSTTRHAVGSEATSPNKRGWSRSVRRCRNASPPSAIDTAKSTGTWPGACIGGSRQVSISAAGHPFTSPVSAASSRGSAVPECD